MKEVEAHMPRFTATELAVNGNEHTAGALRCRADTRALVAGTVQTIALSRQLLADIDSALAMHREVIIRSNPRGWGTGGAGSA